MRGALAIAAAEVRAHRQTLWAGLVVGVGSLLLAVTLLRGGARTTLIVVAGTLLSMCVAVVLGAGAVSRDLAERRLGFYLARPLSPLAYWAGKMSASLFLAKAAGLLVFLPGLLFGVVRDLKPEVVFALALGWGSGLLPLVFLIAAAGAATGAGRARSGLLIVDIVMLPLTWAAVALAVGSTWDAGTSVVLARFGIPWLFTLVTLVLLAAGAAQVCLGRLDVRRGHALLSTITWGGLLACAFGILLFSRFVASATPADLRLPHGVSLHAPQAGRHLVLEGISGRWSLPKSTLWLVPSYFYPGFFLDAHGEFVRMGGFDSVTGFAWSDDGRRFAWSKGAPDVEVTLFGRPLPAIPGFQPSIWIVSFDRPGARPRRVARRSDNPEEVLALSPSGQRLLISTIVGKAVVDVESGRTLASIEESPSWTSPRFLSETVVRALRMGSGQARIVEWDVTSGRLTERGAIALQGDRSWFASFVPTDDWQRVLRFDASGLYLHDLEGRVVATLVDGWPTRMNKTAGPLSGGRYGCIEEGPEGLRLRVFDAEGRPVSEALFKGRFPLRIGGESPAGLLAFGMAPFSDEGKRETLFVDLATGRVTRRETGLFPALRRWELGREFDAANPEPGSLATKLFLSDEGELLLLDPATGSRTVMVSRRDGLED